ncbi:F-box only protein 5 [Lampris incognitus]|uniref:F-box only protein 5 n=1 Tax=Lampris incognitus TaxID=2546036 RepID=UPI0024B4E0EE|nr:F-box only protein 5 [Lampris incognitus]
MKCPSSTRVNKMEKSSIAPAAVATAEVKLFHPKTTPLKEHPPFKSSLSPVLSHNNIITAVHNKENNSNREHNRTLDEASLSDDGFEDSGYLSLHNSRIDERQNPENPSPATCREKMTAISRSASACQRKAASASPVSWVTSSTPAVCLGKSALRFQGSSSTAHNSDPNLPILKFQKAVCEELTKSFQKNKRYDWSVVSKLAEDHLLDRVIGGHMGRDYVDILSSLLSRNMRGILTCILARLGDMDLISCRGVSRTWRKIICEDTSALNRCQRAQQALKESRSCLGQKCCGLTRDAALPRVVMSCIQTLASSKPSSSTPCSRAQRQGPPSQKDNTHTPLTRGSHRTRFNEYLEVAGSLKQHESLRPCRLCGSPAKYFSETQRATCTRPSCQFDFCTHCQEAYHNAIPCRAMLPRTRHHPSKTTPIIPGTARSKRNLRRL